MKPLPNLDDEAAMLLRGRMSTIGKERALTTSALSDAFSSLSGCPWESVEARVATIIELSERLRTLAAMWAELTDDAP